VLDLPGLHLQSWALASPGQCTSVGTVDKSHVGWRDSSPGKRGAATRRSCISSRRLCIGHNSAIVGDHYHARDAATATVDVLCQPPSALADVGLPSSASRSALRAALWVTAAPVIRWVAAVSAGGPTRWGC
jgi:hypothetical protein